MEYDAEAALYPGASYPAMPVQENPAGEKAAEDEKVSGKQINGFHLRFYLRTAMMNYWRTQIFPIRRH